MWVDPVCLVCLKVRKSFEPTTSPVTNYEALFQKCVLLSERFLGLPETTISSLRSVSSRKLTGRMLCTDCQTVIGGTYQLYWDLCAVQIKLGWRLKQLQESIRSHNQLSPKLRSVVRKRVASQLGFPGGSEQVRLVHRQLSRQCAQEPGSLREVSIQLQRISIPDVKIVTSSGNHPTSPALPIPEADAIKVENNIDEGAHEDQDNMFLNYESSQDEDFSPTPANLKREDTTHFPNSVAPVNSIDVVHSKLRARKQTKSYSDRRPWKILKPIKKLGKPKKPSLKFPNDGRDRSELACRVCIHYVANGKRIRRHLSEQHENKWKIRNKSKRPPYQCYFCHWTFACEHSLQVLLELSPHTLYLNKGKFICSEGNCENLEFPNFSDLNMHFEKDHHDQTLFRCSHCSWPFLTDEMRVVHEFVHVKVKSGGSFDCPRCKKKKCTSVIALQNHYIEQHTSLSLSYSKLNSCPICPTKLRYPDRFQEHLRAHEMKSQVSTGAPRTGEYWTCPHEGCCKSYPSSRLLHIHRSVHKTTRCTKCGKMVPKRQLSQHMKVRHKEGQPIPCPKCGKSFFTQDRLKRHTEQVHNPEYPMNKRKCHICQKEYQRAAVLDKHLRDVHQVEALKVPPKFICPECGKGYRDKGSLELHAKHTEESERRWNYKCEICLKGFLRPCLLNKHMSEVHTSGHAATGASDVPIC